MSSLISTSWCQSPLIPEKEIGRNVEKGLQVLRPPNIPIHQINDILFTLFPDVTTKEEMIVAIYKTLDYYINYYPQKRFKGKTAGQVRKEALEAEKPLAYPIAVNPRITKYWQRIEELKNRSSIQT